jgi:hypothetical protein
MKPNFIRLFAVPAILLALGWLGAHAAPKKPIYVGARVCAGCHASVGIGNQYSK